MTLISLNFFIFFLIIMLVYFILPGKIQWAWLLLASMYFYYTISEKSQFYIFIGIIILNWLFSLFLTEKTKYKRAIYITILITDIFILAIFKYSRFFLLIFESILYKINPNINMEIVEKFVTVSENLSPLRISYFALIIIGYITDVYWEKFEPQKNPGKLLLFASYFPQMTSGPIVQYEMMQDNLWGEKHRFSYERMISGLERVIWGIFKKLVISERCSLVVNTIYDHYQVYAGLYIPLAASLFALQLYTDFSGLMDIVLGFSEILGITLPENFDTPFYSLNLSEFWRRWHITLGGFLRDYIMFPLQRSNFFRNMRKAFKKKFGKGYESKCNVPLFLALFVSWFLIGLWHGGGWNYIFGVGLYMWMVIVLGELLNPLFIKVKSILKINTECFSYRLFQRVRTFCLFAFGLSFFRAKTLKDGFMMWKSAFSLYNPWILFDESIFKLGLDRREVDICIFGVIILFTVSLIKQKEPVRKWINRQNYIFRLLVFGVMFGLVLTLGYYGSDFNAADFIYGRF